MTRRLSILAVLLAAISVAVAASAAASRGSTPTLQGEVGPGFSIEVKLAGKDVKTLKAGTYRLVVEDKAAIHDFHVLGPGLNKTVTSVAFVGKKTVVVKLKKGTYTYQCDPHASFGMRGHFKVT
jgi:plastocyanin